MEYKVFIMEILNDLYLVREDVKEGPGYDAITALIKKVESRPMEIIEQGREAARKSMVPKQTNAEVKINSSKTDFDGVYMYEFKK